MRMNDVCKQTGLTKKAIHHYIDCGLIHISKSDNNYYNFSSDDITRLKKIALLRSMGVRIQTIKNIFETPEAINYFLVEQSNQLFQELQEKLDTYLKLSELTNSLPHNATPNDLPNTLPSLESSTSQFLLQLPHTLNDRMLAIYIFAPYTDEFVTEYRRFLWEKIEHEVHRQFQDSLLEACAYYSMNHAQKMVHKCSNDYQTMLTIFHSQDLTPFINQFIQDLETFINTPQAIETYNIHYNTVFIPTLKTYDICSRNVLSEFSTRFSVCTDKVNQIIQSTIKQIEHTSLKENLYQNCHCTDESFYRDLFFLFHFNPIYYI